MKRKDSFSGLLDNAIAGIIAPNKLPKWGVPVLCTPVSIFAIIFFFLDRKVRKDFRKACKVYQVSLLENSFQI